MAGIEKVTFEKVAIPTEQDKARLATAVAGFVDFHRMMAEIMADHAQCYRASNGALVVLREEPEKNTLFVWAIAGKGAVKVLKVVKAWAQQKGFLMAEFATTKPHLTKLLKFLRLQPIASNDGFNHYRVVFYG